MMEVLPHKKKKWGYVKGHCNILLVLQLCVWGEVGPSQVRGTVTTSHVATTVHHRWGEGGGQRERPETSRFERMIDSVK